VVDFLLEKGDLLQGDFSLGILGIKRFFLFHKECIDLAQGKIFFVQALAQLFDLPAPEHFDEQPLELAEDDLPAVKQVVPQGLEKRLFLIIFGVGIHREPRLVAGC
jgi:hypothetical protein